MMLLMIVGEGGNKEDDHLIFILLLKEFQLEAMSDHSRSLSGIIGLNVCFFSGSVIPVSLALPKL